MTLEELKDEARKILEINAAGEGMSAITFSTNSGGPVRVQVPGIVPLYAHSEFAYNTVRNGNAFKGTLTINCRATGAKDRDGRKIYVTPDGVTFVYNYRSGSPEDFDRGRITSPSL
jgi:hypothetical protein